MRVISLGRNAGTIARAGHLAFLIDGAAYYAELAHAIRQAEKRIWIIGWDFDPDVLLTPDKADDARLADLMAQALEARPGLEIRILVWGLGPLYSGKSLKLFRREGVLAHPRVKIRFDRRHPFLASHHQKMVVIDGGLGFIGGIDLTGGRWDDSAHRADNRLRVKPDGSAYEPVHDLQVMLDGAAATAIEDLARRRWRHATGEKTAPTMPGRPLWPTGRAGDLRDVAIALSVTDPERPRTGRQSMLLARDAIEAAKAHIYIEAQYLASFGFADMLAARLEEPDGPEIVVIVTRISHGLIEKLVMGRNRDRIIRRLKQVDRHDRLWVMYAVVPDERQDDGQQEILVHSKLIIVDDDFVRAGSSNLNNRSEGLDTEADLSIEAQNAAERRAIAGLRHRLLAEHLDVTPEHIAETFAVTGSLLKTIARHNKGPRGLRHFDIDVHKGSVAPIAGTAVVDPTAPVFSWGAWQRMRRVLKTCGTSFGAILQKRHE